MCVGVSVVGWKDGRNMRVRAPRRTLAVDEPADDDDVDGAVVVGALRPARGPRAELVGVDGVGDGGEERRVEPRAEGEVLAAGVGDADAVVHVREHEAHHLFGGFVRVGVGVGG